MRYILIVLLMMTISACAFAENELDIPDAGRQPIFFESINKRTSSVGLTPLRKEKLSDNDLEIRFWIEVSFSYPEGYIFSKSGSDWLARHIPADSDPTIQNLETPRSGWLAFISKMEKSGLYTLPDSSTLKDEIFVFDGTSYVIEILKNNKYRTYTYHNPEYQSWPEAKSILNIAKTIKEEFSTHYK